MKNLALALAFVATATVMAAPVANNDPAIPHLSHAWIANVSHGWPIFFDSVYCYINIILVVLFMWQIEPAKQ